MTSLADVESFFSRYSRAWDGVVAPPILAHWDRARFQYYKAEEVKRFFHEMNDLEAYFFNNEKLHKAVRLRFSDFALRPLSAPYAVVTMRMAWRISFLDEAPGSLSGSIMGGDNHILALITTDGDALRLAGWSETPDAPITYVRDLYTHRGRLEPPELA